MEALRNVQRQRIIINEIKIEYYEIYHYANGMPYK